MQEWSIGVVAVVVLVVAFAGRFRFPWHRTRVLRVESRIGTAAVEFAPPSRLKRDRTLSLIHISEPTRPY